MTLPKGITWPSVTTGVVQLPVAHAHTQGNPEGVKWPSVAMLLLLRKKRRTYFRLGPLPDMGYSGHVTLSLPVKRPPLGRIWRNFRLRMRRRYFRTMTEVTFGHVTHVTSGHVTSGHFRSYAMVRSPANVILSVPIYYYRQRSIVIIILDLIKVTKNRKPFPAKWWIVVKNLSYIGDEFHYILQCNCLKKKENYIWVVIFYTESIL